MRIYCECGVRLAKMKLDQWVGVTSHDTRAQRANVEAVAAVTPFNLDKIGTSQDRHCATASAPAVLRPEQNRWEWKCGGCGRHVGANKDRLQQELERGHRTLTLS